MSLSDACSDFVSLYFKAKSDALRATAFANFCDMVEHYSRDPWDYTPATIAYLTEGIKHLKEAKDAREELYALQSLLIRAEAFRADSDTCGEIVIEPDMRFKGIKKARNTMARREQTVASMPATIEAGGIVFERRGVRWEQEDRMVMRSVEYWPRWFSVNVECRSGAERLKVSEIICRNLSEATATAAAIQFERSDVVGVSWLAASTGEAVTGGGQGLIFNVVHRPPDEAGHSWAWWCWLAAQYQVSMRPWLDWYVSNRDEHSGRAATATEAMAAATDAKPRLESILAATLDAPRARQRQPERVA